MLNKISTRYQKQNTLIDLTPIACFSTTSQNPQEVLTIKKQAQIKLALNKKSIGTALKKDQDLNSELVFCTKNQKLQEAKEIYQSLLEEAPFYKNKSNFIKKLLVLIKLKKSLSQSLAISTHDIDQIAAKTLEQNRLSQKKLQITLFDSRELIQRQGLKPFSTVTGFKKFMYNFVKLSQSQLQPGYNRRKYSHSHYNQTLKESTRLSRIYAYLSKNLIKNLCGFAINPTLVKTSSKIFDTVSATKKSLALCNQVLNRQNGRSQKGLICNVVTKRYDKTKTPNYQVTFHRPIPKVVNSLESRLDVILWRNQLVCSIRGARQKLQQGIRLNKGLQKTTSYQTLPGDVFTFDK